MLYVLEFGPRGEKSLIFRTVEAKGREDAIDQAQKVRRELQAEAGKDKDVYFYSCRRKPSSPSHDGEAEETKQEKRASDAVKKGRRSGRVTPEGKVVENGKH